MIAALGEEIGWRGFLYPQLEAGVGRRKGWILGGIIWGAWHWPLIWLIGYEYGAAAGNSVGYAGFPVTGMLLFLLFDPKADPPFVFFAHPVPIDKRIDVVINPATIFFVFIFLFLTFFV